MNPNTSKENVDHEEDRLSNLPDDILTRILSHLGMKEIVRSGILSKRWKSVWLSVPTLFLYQWDFSLGGRDHNQDDDTIARFLNFVNEMLIARKLPCLEKISIRYLKLDPRLVELWMQSALERDVRNLEVTNFGYPEFDGDGKLHSPELTQNLFSYNKLVVLKLCGYIAPNFPKNSSCFPSLKELELKDIYYRDCDSLPNLLSSCPFLEYMTIIREDDWDRRVGNTGTLIITSRSLKRLTVNSQLDDFLTQYDVFKMVIDAPALEFLDILCYITSEYDVKNLSSLVKAKLNFVDWFSVLAFLKSAPQLEILILHKTHNVSELSELDVPSCLITQLKTIHMSFSLYDNIEKVRYFLKNAEVLERMTITCYEINEILKSELCNVIHESAADSVTWSTDKDPTDPYRTDVVVSFSKPRI